MNPSGGAGQSQATAGRSGEIPQIDCVVRVADIKVGVGAAARIVDRAQIRRRTPDRVVGKAVVAVVSAGHERGAAAPDHVIGQDVVTVDRTDGIGLISGKGERTSAQGGIIADPERGEAVVDVPQKRPTAVVVGTREDGGPTGDIQGIGAGKDPVHAAADHQRAHRVQGGGAKDVARTPEVINPSKRSDTAAESSRVRRCGRASRSELVAGKAHQVEVREIECGTAVSTEDQGGGGGSCIGELATPGARRIGVTDDPNGRVNIDPRRVYGRRGEGDVVDTCSRDGINAGKEKRS